MKPFLPYCLGLFLLGILACQPQVDVVTIPDNTAPPDHSVPEVVKTNYVNRLYISLLGRKPSEEELFFGFSILDQNNAIREDRKTVVQHVLSKSEFSQRQFNVARLNLLQNVDTATIGEQIQVLNYLLTQPEYEPFYDFIEGEIDKLEALLAVPVALTQQQINRIEMHRRCVNNFIYDEINMGTLNFVLSVFEHFLGRYPTTAEERAATLMVDGINQVLFGKEGDSKDDFLDIFLDTDAYFEGEVVDVYESFLFRAPDSYEMSEATKLYRQNSDYRALLTDILSTDEYLGL